MDFSRGSEWRKWDLHLHTASSYDYGYKGTDSNKLLIDALRRNCVSAICVTDHFVLDADRIVNLRSLAPEIVVFPGIELRTDKGDTNIHMILIFDEKSNLDELAEDVKFFKRDKGKEIDNVEKIYWDFNDIVEFAEKHDAIISVHAGSKSNGMDRQITNALEHNQAVKDEYDKYVHIYEMGKEEDLDDYRKHVFATIREKPMVICSDNHDPRSYVTKVPLWIKSDLTFEGLRQILFEPAERVRIQEAKPEEKSPYQVIDSITVSEDGFWEQEIPLNSNLVTIIGGRSSGKSTLLGCIATKIGYSQEYDDPVYSDEEKQFIQDHQNSLTVKWADNGGMQDHQVDFFRQNYMIHLQSDRKEIDKLIAKILKATPENAARFSKYEQFLIDTKADITKDCALLFSQREKIDALDLEIKEKGGLDGHAKQVEALARQLDEKKKQHSSLAEDEQLEFDRIKSEVEKHKEELGALKQDQSAIVVLIEEEEAIEAPSLDDSMFSDKVGKSLVEKYSAMWQDFHGKWLSFLRETRDKFQLNINEMTAKLKELISTDVYKKGMEDISTNSILKDLENKLTNEKAKYAEVAALAQQRKKLQDENLQLIQSLSERHCSYQTRARQFVSSITWSNEDLLIKGMISVKTALNERLEGQITRKARQQQEYFDSLIKHEEFDVSKASLFLNNVMERKISYNQDVDEQYLVSEFLSSNWFDINYDIVYQGDTFSAMSPGKRAFVILRLLLEFGNNECPILIDQPEDSLDNRAIFTELVQYLRDKKKKRQIILVTHNPNVVVGADAEQVIVANQTGSKNENVDRLKFSYVSGALENSRPKNTACPTVLESQGIREHVCEILEGGEDAFKKRESKYGFSY